MTIVYRSEKGSNLSAGEIDGNFADIDGRVTTIEENPPAAVVPISASMTVGSYTLGFSNDTSYTVTFTMPQPFWRGNWQPGASYHELDYFVGTDGGWGVVVADHIAGDTFDWDATDSDGDALYLKLVGPTGETGSLSNLTDVAITSAAVGDMLIWGGAYWYNATPDEVTLNLVPFIGDSGTAGTRGLVPAPGAGDAAASKFLSASGAWAVPPTGSGGSSSLGGLSDVAISSPGNNSLLQYKASDGKWHNVTLPELGAGTVTQVAAGAGLAGGPIETTGTLSLASIATNLLLANTSIDLAPPIPTSLTTLLDATAGSARGSIVTRTASGWQALGPGAAGEFLGTGGSGSDVSWGSPAGAGTVTSVTAGAGLSGGTITGSGTLALASVADGSIIANVSGATAPPGPTTQSLLLDHVIGSTRGAVLTRTGSTWIALAPGADGTVLTSAGTGADLAWEAGGSGASVTVSETPPADPAAGQLWFDTASACMFVWYEDSTAGAWVVAVNVGSVAGGSAAGVLSISATAPLSASAPEGDVVLSLAAPLDIAFGGTGSASAPAALTALGAAPINSPVFTGDARSVTPATSDNDTSIATTAFVKAQGYVIGGPYLPLAGGTLSGQLTARFADNGGYQFLAAGTTYGVRVFTSATAAHLEAVTQDVGAFAPLILSGTTVTLSIGATPRLSIAATGATTITGDTTINGTTQGQLTLNSPNNTTPVNAIMTVPSVGQYTLALDSSGMWGIYHNTAGAWRLQLNGTACLNTTGSWTAISDGSLKQQIEPYERGLDAVLALTPVSFRYAAGTPFAPADEPSDPLVGLLAHEVEPHIPEMCGTVTVKIRDEPREVQTLNPGDLTYVLINAIKELEARVRELEARPPNPPEALPA